MGILGLSKLIFDKAPDAVKEQELKNYFGRRIAIDASMTIYQFLIVMKNFRYGQEAELTDEHGMVTSHLNGLFTRTLRMIDEGMKPIYVFDGKPPVLKQHELAGRRQRADEAEEVFKQAKEAGDEELMEKMSKRTVRVSREQMDECKKLLRLMGLPVVEAPSEAEAQCSELVSKGKAWAVATEDMDALAFGATILLRHLHITEAKKRPVSEFHLSTILAQTGFSRNQFIDLCILLGCDYVPKIPGIGPHKAWELINKHGSIEEMLKHLEGTKHTVPEDFLYKEARELFVSPEVIPADEINIQFCEPDEEGLINFLVGEKQFNKERVCKGIARLRAALTTKTQGRLDQFFKISPKVPEVTSKRPREHASVGTVAGKLARRGTGHKKAVNR